MAQVSWEPQGSWVLRVSYLLPSVNEEPSKQRQQQSSKQRRRGEQKRRVARRVFLLSEEQDLLEAQKNRSKEIAVGLPKDKSVPEWCHAVWKDKLSGQILDIGIRLAWVNHLLEHEEASLPDQRFDIPLPLPSSLLGFGANALGHSWSLGPAPDDAPSHGVWKPISKKDRHSETGSSPFPPMTVRASLKVTPCFS